MMSISIAVDAAGVSLATPSEIEGDVRGLKHPRVNLEATELGLVAKTHLQ